MALEGTGPYKHPGVLHHLPALSPSRSRGRPLAFCQPLRQQRCQVCGCEGALPFSGPSALGPPGLFERVLDLTSGVGRLSCRTPCAPGSGVGLRIGSAFPLSSFLSLPPSGLGHLRAAGLPCRSEPSLLLACSTPPLAFRVRVRLPLAFGLCFCPAFRSVPPFPQAGLPSGSSGLVS